MEVVIAEDDDRGDVLRLLWGSVRLCAGEVGRSGVAGGSNEVLSW